MTSAASISHSACRIRAYDSSAESTRAAAGSGTREISTDDRGGRKFGGARSQSPDHATPTDFLRASHGEGEFGSGEQARQRQLEGGCELDQTTRSGSPGRSRSYGSPPRRRLALGEVGERPAASVPFETDALGERVG